MTENQFQAKTFVDDVKTVLQGGQEALDRIVDAYLWANKNIKEIHRHWPNYRQQWLRREIRRVFNISVHQYCRTAVKLGGGKSSNAMKRGHLFMRKFGPMACMTAEKRLRVQDMGRLYKEIGMKGTKKDFNSLVNKLAADLEVITPKEKEGDFNDSINFKREYYRLIKENARLKKSLKDLKDRLKAIKLSLRQ